MNHTPGPWAVYQLNGNRWVQSDQGTAVARVITDSKADAHLIAAAPEMLSALKIWIRERPSTAGKTLEMIDQAIARAEGKQ